MVSPRTDSPGVLDFVRTIINRTLMEIAGVRVGIVQLYDPLTGTADVQPVRFRTYYDTPQLDPPVLKAPVGWWRFGGMVLAGDLEVGDQVLIVNLEREIAKWWTTGLVGPEATTRMYDSADVVVLPWIQSLAVTPTGHGGPALKAPGSFRLGRVDGLAGLTMWPGPAFAETPLGLTVELEGGPAGIKLGKTAVEPAVKATTFVALMDTSIAAAITAAALIAPPAGDSGASAFTAFQTAWNLAKANILTGKTILE